MLNSAELYKTAYAIHYREIRISNDNVKSNQIAYLLYKNVLENFKNTAEERYSLSQIENLNNKGINDESISDDVKLIYNKIIETNGDYLQELIKQNKDHKINSSKITNNFKNSTSDKGSLENYSDKISRYASTIWNIGVGILLLLIFAGLVISLVLESIIYIIIAAFIGGIILLSSWIVNIFANGFSIIVKDSEESIEERKNRNIEN